MSNNAPAATSDQKASESPVVPTIPLPKTHANHLAAMARLFGVPSASPATARVLELGCGTGANLLPMADAFPLASFVGVDPVGASIERGRRFAEAAKLTNVELRNEEFTAFSAPGRTFDYIIVHGVFSRVPEATQRRLWEICRAHLAPNGIAYFSYDVLPGANMRRSVREIAQFHTSRLPEPTAKVKQARAVLKFLADSVPGEDHAYGVMLRDELRFASKLNDPVVFNDYLAPDRSAVYFHEFIAQARAHGLQYLCESTLADMLTANFPGAVTDTLGRVNHLIAQEQYMDFLRNRMMRQTLLCSVAQPIQRALGPEVIRSLAFQATFSSEPKVIDLRPGTAVVLSGTAGQQVSTDNPFTKAVLGVLADYAMRAVGFAELLEAARARSRPFVERPAGDPGQEDEAVLAATLLNLLSKGFIDIHAEASPAGREVPAKPKVSDFHRLQARADIQLTSRLNASIPIDTLGRLIVGLCDGSRTVEQIINAVVREGHLGRLNVQVGKKPLRDEAKLRATLAPRVQAILKLLARGGLLLAPTAS
jgi:methyltransferase-like protein/SAM-dependent methyltransferase